MAISSNKELDAIRFAVKAAHNMYGSDRKSVALLAAHKEAKAILKVESLSISLLMQAWKVLTYKKECCTPVKFLVTCPACGEWNTFYPSAFRMSGHLVSSNPCVNPFCDAELDTEDPFEVVAVSKEEEDWSLGEPEIETWEY